MIVGIVAHESDQTQRWWNDWWCHNDNAAAGRVAWRLALAWQQNPVIRICGTHSPITGPVENKLRALVALYASVCLLVYCPDHRRLWPILQSQNLSGAAAFLLLSLATTLLSCCLTLLRRLCVVWMHAPEPYRLDQYQFETDAQHSGAMSDGDWRLLFQSELEPGVVGNDIVHFGDPEIGSVRLTTFHSTRWRSAFCYNVALRLLAVHALLLQCTIVTIVRALFLLLLDSSVAGLEACLAHIVVYRMIPVTVAFFSAPTPPQWIRAAWQVCTEAFVFFALCSVCIDGQSTWWFPLAALYSQSAALMRLGDIRCRFLSSATSN